MTTPRPWDHQRARAAGHSAAKLHQSLNAGFACCALHGQLDCCRGQGAFTERERLLDALPGFTYTLASPTAPAARRSLGAAVSGFVALAQQHRHAQQPVTRPCHSPMANH